jgi:hypothetical protein
MRHRGILLTGLAITMACAYMYLVVMAIGYAAAIPMPAWWRSAFSSRLVGLLVFMVGWHTLAVVVAALPFSWGISQLYGRFGWLVALAITSVTTIFLVTPTFILLGSVVSASHVGIQISDYVILIGAMPVLTWLLYPRPLTTRSSGP